MKSETNTNGRMFHVKEIVFISGSRLNVDVAFFDDFIVVSGDGEEEPTFYNKSIVVELRGVIATPSQSKS